MQAFARLLPDNRPLIAVMIGGLAGCAGRYPFGLGGTADRACIRVLRRCDCRIVCPAPDQWRNRKPAKSP